MKEITRYQTRDGVLHKTSRDAEQYADRMFCEASHRLAGTLFNLIHSDTCRVSDVAQYLRLNVDEFVKLAELRDDVALQEER